MNMVITNQQEAEKFVLSYLETHQELLEVIWQKFPRKKVSRKQKLPMVDAETNERIGQALAEHKAGNYVIIEPTDDILYALNNFDELLEIQKTKRK